MKRLQLQSREINKKELLRRKADESDTSITYSQPGIYCLDQKPVIIYGKISGRSDSVRTAIKNFPVKQEVRSSNINRFGGGFLKEGKRRGLGESGIFGFRPRVPFGANYCAVASSSIDCPSEHQEVCSFGRILDLEYEKHAPEIAAQHKELLQREVRSEWIIPGTRFTSGIVNQNNPLNYHYDRGNLIGVMSCMIVFRELCTGGFLSLPEFDAKWLLEDNSFFFFDGQSFLHGVTPIKRLNKNGYRYSVVYYALRAMGKCGSPTEEVARCRSEKRKREKKRTTQVETPSS